jgi:hypothetical protein
LGGEAQTLEKEGETTGKIKARRFNRRQGRIGRMCKCKVLEKLDWGVKSWVSSWAPGYTQSTAQTTSGSQLC